MQELNFNGQKFSKKYSNKNKTNFKLVFFIFSLLFLPKIGLLDFKIIICLYYLMMIYLKKRKIVLHKISIFLLLIIIGLIFLLSINYFLFSSTELYIMLRYFRCILTLITIDAYVSVHSFKSEEVLRAIIICLLIHAICIILSMISPTIKDILSAYSGYNKKDLVMRASGLLNGYDFAGYYTNIGLVATIFYNISNKNKYFSIASFIFIIATIFTSRTNILFLAIIICFTLINIIKKLRISSIISILIMIPVIMVGLIYIILTIDLFDNVKEYLINNYEIVDTINSTINNSYSSSDLNETISQQYNIEDDLNIFFGEGKYANTDPGIINTIYETGMIGLFIKITFYLLILYIAKLNFVSTGLNNLLIFMILFTIVFEIKLIFLFATGSFELILVCFYVVQSEPAIKNNLK